MIYTNDKTQRITLRLNEKQFDFIRDNAELLGTTPSQFLRILVNVAMTTYSMTEERVKEGLTESPEDFAEKLKTKAGELHQELSSAS